MNMLRYPSIKLKLSFILFSIEIKFNFKIVFVNHSIQEKNVNHTSQQITLSIPYLPMNNDNLETKKYERKL